MRKKICQATRVHVSLKTSFAMVGFALMIDVSCT